MNKKMKKRRGFTLAEMIISVGILAVVSVYILQMAVATRNLGIKSHEIDEAVRISKNIIEVLSIEGSVSKNSSYDILQSMESVDGIYTVKLDENFAVSSGDKSLYKVDMTLNQKDELNDINIRIERLKSYLMDKKSNLEISNISSVKMIKK